MAYNIKLSDRLREYLAKIPEVQIEEKEMFGMLNFMVDGKTCVCVSGENLMLRFNPYIQHQLAEKRGYETMLMKGKTYKGYCYIHPEGFKERKDFAYFVNLCLEYNKIAKASKK